MKKCNICYSFNDPKEKYCHYCGYILDIMVYGEDERYDLYCRTDNIKTEGSKIFIKTKRIKNALAKRNIIFDKIQIEKERVNKINSLLVNISSNENRVKIESIKSKVEDLISDLLKCRIDIEFLKYVGNYNALKNIANRNEINENDVNEQLSEQQIEISSWISKIVKLYPVENIKIYCDTKELLFKRMKEEIALIMISGILSKTSLLKSKNEAGFEQDEVTEIENEVERINFEIDRLNGELTL
jgi:hypothetical protein